MENDEPVITEENRGVYKNHFSKPVQMNFQQHCSYQTYVLPWMKEKRKELGKFNTGYEQKDESLTPRKEGRKTPSLTTVELESKTLMSPPLFSPLEKDVELPSAREANMPPNAVLPPNSQADQSECNR